MQITRNMPTWLKKNKDYLTQMEHEGKLFDIIEDGQKKGFYVLDGHMFKCLYVFPEFRRQGVAKRVIKNIARQMRVTIAVTKTMCPIKHIIIGLGFQQLPVAPVQGKCSTLYLWAN